MLFDAELMRGNHAAIISDLSGLVSRETPFHEQFCEQLIIALYRSGRHADALATFRRHRHQLIDSTGSESSVLRLYERAILCHDPILTAPRTRSSRGSDSRLARMRV
jgi:DNA-binding SARP family transcriptional activator